MRYISTLIFTVALGALLPLSAQTWTSIATDTMGDGASTLLLDGTELEFSYDPASDSLWFRVTVTGINTTQEADFGVNIMVDIPNGGDRFAFWGVDNMNMFHKMITVWVTGTPPSNYTGDIGIADSAGVMFGNWDNLFSDNISIDVNTAANTIVLGMKRTDLITDTEFPGTMMTFNVAAAVGSSISWNDDIYQATGTMTLDKGGTGVEDMDRTNVIGVYPQPASSVLHLDLSQLQGRLETLELLSMDGKKILARDQFTSSFISLGTKAIVAGNYLLLVQTDEVRIARQIMLR